LVDWGRRGHVSYIPKMRTQLIAARTVAEALAKLANDDTASRPDLIPEVAGPREERLAQVARLLVARRGDAITIEEVSDRDDPDSALFVSGGLLPSSHAVLAGPTYQEWLHATS
jgi:hypothetical protein